MKLGPEAQDQIALLEWIGLAHPNLLKYVISIPNERKTSQMNGYILKKMGLRPGASDLFIFNAVHPYFGLFLEMKSKVGKASIAQLEFIELVNKSGYKGVICYGLDQAIEAIETYLSGADHAKQTPEFNRFS